MFFFFFEHGFNGLTRIFNKNFVFFKIIYNFAPLIEILAL